MAVACGVGEGRADCSGCPRREKPMKEGKIRREEKVSLLRHVSQASKPEKRQKRRASKFGQAARTKAKQRACVAGKYLSLVTDSDLCPRKEEQAGVAGISSENGEGRGRGHCVCGLEGRGRL